MFLSSWTSHIRLYTCPSSLCIGLDPALNNRSTLHIYRSLARRGSWAEFRQWDQSGHTYEDSNGQWRSRVFVMGVAAREGGFDDRNAVLVFATFPRSVSIQCQKSTTRKTDLACSAAINSHRNFHNTCDGEELVSGAELFCESFACLPAIIDPCGRFGPMLVCSHHSHVLCYRPTQHTVMEVFALNVHPIFLLVLFVPSYLLFL